MLYSIPQTKMLSANHRSLLPDSRQRSIFNELMIFLLVAMIASFAMSFVQSTVTSTMMMYDPAYLDLIEQSMESGRIDMSLIMEYMTNFMNSLPGDIYILFLASSGLYIAAGIIYCRCIEKRRLFTMGFNKNGVVSEYLLGILVGAAMLTLPALVCKITGCVTFLPDPNASPLKIVLFFLAFVLQGMGEEVLFRGYLMMSLCRRNKEWVAIIVSAFMFAAFHITNANFSIIAFINIVLFGIFAGVFMLKRGSIWAIGAIHTAWNFMQGNVFGINVSGNPKFSSILTAQNADFGSILSGGEFGLEGGLGVTVVLLVSLLITLMMPAKNSELDPEFNKKATNE